MGINIYRKALHFSFGLFLYFLNYQLSSLDFFIILAFFWLFLSILEIFRLYLYKWFPFKILYSVLLKKEEEKRINDAWFFLSGTILGWYILNKNPEYFRIVLLILTLADPLASISGYFIGKHKIKNNKTLEGSLTFFLISLLIVVFSLKKISESIFLFCIFLALTEALTKRDNFWIPLVGSIYLRIISI